MRIKEKRIRIAVFVPEIYSTDYSKNADCIVEELKKYNAITAIYVTGFDGDEQNGIIDSLTSTGMIDGILSMSSGINVDSKCIIPTVYFFRSDDTRRDSVYTDLYSGLSQAVNHLKQLGHTKIGIMSEKIPYIFLRIWKK